MTELSVSVVVPVFNEQDSIVSTIALIRDVLEENRFTYEIVVVNDGCTDDTSRRLVEAAGSEERITVIEHRENMGYGAAIKSGLARCAFDRILIIDADQSYPIGKLPDLLKLSEDYDMVVGARTGSEARVPLLRRPAKAILKWMAEALSDRSIPDINSGLRVFDKRIATKFAHMLPDGFSLTTTITLLWIHHGHSVQYLPIPYSPRVGKSKIRPIRDTLNFVQLILRTIVYVNPLRVFVPAGLFFLAISAILFLIRVFFGPAFLVTTVISFFCGFQLLVIGVLADLIDKRLR